MSVSSLPTDKGVCDSAPAADDLGSLYAGRAAGTILLLMGLSVVGTLLAFVREAVMAAFFGASAQTDAYVLAVNLPTMLFAALGVALGAVFIPVFIRRQESEGYEAAIRTTNSLLTLLLTAMLLLVFLIEVFMPQVVRVIAPGFSDEVLGLTVALSRWTVPIILFAVLGSILSSLLQVRLRFVFPALANVVSSSVLVGTIVVSGLWGKIEGAAVGALLAAAVLFLVNAMGMRSTGYRYRPVFAWRDPGLVQMGMLAVPVILSTGAGQISLIVNRALASNLETGSIAALNYALRLQGLPIQILALAISTVVFPLMSREAGKRDLLGLGRTFERGIQWTILVLVPSVVILMVFGEPIVRLFYQRGAFDSQATEMTSFALFLYGPGIVFIAIRDLGNRAMFALANAWPVVLGAIAEVSVTIALSIVWVSPLGIGGLALAASVGPIVSSLLLLWFVSKRTGKFALVELLGFTFKVFVAGAVMALAIEFVLHVHGALFAEHITEIGATAVLIVLGSMLGCSVFVAVCWLLRIEVLRSLILVILARLRERISFDAIR